MDAVGRISPKKSNVTPAGPQTSPRRLDWRVTGEETFSSRVGTREPNVSYFIPTCCLRPAASDRGDRETADSRRWLLQKVEIAIARRDWVTVLGHVVEFQESFMRHGINTFGLARSAYRPRQQLRVSTRFCLALRAEKRWTREEVDGFCSVWQG